MGAIFLSYSHRDRSCAERLAEVLKQAGHDVWWDRHIEGGSEFAPEIEAQLDKADIVLVAWSKASVQSRWVRDEASVGGDSGRLVPISVDGIAPPMGFRQFQTIDFGGWKGAKRDARTAELLQAIERRLSPSRSPAEEDSKPKVKRTPSARRSRSLIGIAAIIVLILAAGSLLFLLKDGASGPDPPGKPTIAILPFTATAGGDETRVIAAQARDALAHMLSKSGVPVRVVGEIPGNLRDAGDFVISGEFSRTTDGIVAAIRVEDASRAVTIYAKRFEARQNEARDLPDRVGAQMTGTLTWAAPLMALDQGHPTDPTVIADLIQQGDFTGDLLQAYQISQRAVVKAPDSAMAQLSLAFNTGFILADLPRGERSDAISVARRAASRAQELAPKFGDTYGAWCFLHSEVRMAECEDRVLAGKRIDPAAPFLNSFLGELLRNVGRFDESVELTRLSYSHDPYLPTKIAWLLRSLEYIGATADAAKLHQDGMRWWPEYAELMFRNRLHGRMERGDFNSIRTLEEQVGEAQLRSDYSGSDKLVAAVNSRSVTDVRSICASGGEDFQIRCLFAFAAVGDLDRAYALLDSFYDRRVGRTTEETERIWLNKPHSPPVSFITSPAAAPLRRDPRYLLIAQRVGLLDYWRSGRPPDFCRARREPVCAQILKNR
jgi:TolB-like protein